LHEAQELFHPIKRLQNKKEKKNSRCCDFSVLPKKNKRQKVFAREKLLSCYIFIEKISLFSPFRFLRMFEKKAVHKVTKVCFLDLCSAVFLATFSLPCRTFPGFYFAIFGK
jgi:hypothetical protein